MDINQLDSSRVGFPEVSFVKDCPSDVVNSIVDEMMLQADEVLEFASEARVAPQDPRQQEVVALREEEYEESQSKLGEALELAETGHGIAHGSLYEVEGAVQLLHRKADEMRVAQADVGVAAVGLLLTAASVPELKVKYAELGAKHAALMRAGKEDEAAQVKQEQKQILKEFVGKTIGSSLKGAKQGLGYAASHAHASAHVMHGLKIASMTAATAFGILAAVVTIADLKDAYGLSQELATKLEKYQQAFAAAKDPAVKQVLLLKTAHILQRQEGNRARTARGVTFMSAIVLGGLKAAGVAAAFTGPIGASLAGVAALGYLAYQGVRNREVLANRLEVVGTKMSNKVCELKLAAAEKRASKGQTEGKRAEAVVSERLNRVKVAGNVYQTHLNELEKKLKHAGGFWERRSLQKEIRHTEEQLRWFQSYNRDIASKAKGCRTKAQLSRKKALSKIRVTGEQVAKNQERLRALEQEGIDAKQAMGLKGVSGPKLRQMKTHLGEELLQSESSVGALKAMLEEFGQETQGFDEAPIEAVFTFVLSDD